MQREAIQTPGAIALKVDGEWIVTLKQVDAAAAVCAELALDFDEIADQARTWYDATQPRLTMRECFEVAMLDALRVRERDRQLELALGS